MQAWWLKHLKIPEIRDSYGLTGNSVKLSLLDTGLDPEYIDIKKAIKDYHDFIRPEFDVEDMDGHGTQMAEIIGAHGKLTGIAPDSELFIGRVMSLSSILHEDHLCDGLEWAVDAGVDIISLCCALHFHYPRLEKIVEKAYQKNIIIAAASGNSHKEGPDAISYPARYDQCISVGSMNKDQQVSDFTNKNPSLDILAPGENINITLPGYNDSLLNWGTSQATAIVSGAIALILEFCRKKKIPYTSESVKSLIKQSGKNITYKDMELKSLNLWAVLEQLNKEFPDEN